MYVIKVLMNMNVASADILFYIIFSVLFNIKWTEKNTYLGLYFWPESSSVFFNGYFSGASESIHEGVVCL